MRDGSAGTGSSIGVGIVSFGEMLGSAGTVAVGGHGTEVAVCLEAWG